MSGMNTFRAWAGSVPLWPRSPSDDDELEEEDDDDDDDDDGQEDR